MDLPRQDSFRKSHDQNAPLVSAAVAAYELVMFSRTASSLINPLLHLQIKNAVGAIRIELLSMVTPTLISVA